MFKCFQRAMGSRAALRARGCRTKASRVLGCRWDAAKALAPTGTPSSRRQGLLFLQMHAV